MSQTQWKQLPSHDSRVGPALSAHGDGRLYLVAVTPTGDVVCSTSAECQAGWSAWAVVNGPPGGNVRTAAPRAWGGRSREGNRVNQASAIAPSGCRALSTPPRRSGMFENQ